MRNPRKWYAGRVSLRPVPLALVCAGAMARALSAPELAEPPPASQKMLVEAFQFVTDSEQEDRDRSRHGFPGDIWSEDDDFHLAEAKRARTFAVSRSMSLSDVLAAVDMGLRARWQPTRSVVLLSTVPPCHPRPND